MLLVAGMVVALALSGGGGEEDRGETAATAPVHPAEAGGGGEVPGAVTEPPTDSTFAAEPEQAIRAASLAVLRRYEDAYAGAGIAEMSELLAPDVERHGLSAGGCSTVHGKRDVLSAYRSQFSLNGPVPYRLVGLSPADVELYGDREARVETEYTISSTGNSGAIGFVLVEDGEGWRISGIDATCNPSSS